MWFRARRRWKRSSVLWAGSEIAQVYLGQRTAGVADPLAESAAGVAWITGDSAADCWQLAIESLAPARWRKRKVHVLLSGALARPFMMSPVAGLRSWREAAQVGSSLAPDATGLAGPCEVWHGAWTPDAASLVVAIDAELRQLIESTARQARVRLAGLQPWWAAALQQASQQSPATRFLAAEDTDSLTVVCGDDESFSAATSYAPCPQSDQTDALFTRLLLAQGAAPDLAVHATLRTDGPDAADVATPFAARWKPAT